MHRKPTLLLSRRSVLARCEVEHRFWHGARIEEAEREITFKTLWRNPELWGVWESSYRLTPHCLALLLESGHFVRAERQDDGRCVYRLRD